MSKVNKRKHVIKEMELNDFEPPAGNELIARVVGSRGNNLHEVETAEPFQSVDNDESSASLVFLVTMPNKFRKNIWIKTGSFVIVEPISEGKKVKGEITRILQPHTITEFKKLGVWPDKFTTKQQNPQEADKDRHSEDDSDEELFRNPNRPPVLDAESDSSDDDSSADDDDDGDDADDDDDDDDDDGNEDNHNKH